MSTETRSTDTASGGGVVVVKERRGGALRGFFIFVGLVFLAIALLVGLATVNLLPSFIKNPFATKTVDRSGPVLVESIKGMNKLISAEGNYQVVVDYEEDVPYVPDFIAGYHALLEVHGSVDATVDLSQLTAADIQISADGKGVTVTLPDPELTPVRLDVAATKFYVLNSGVVNRLKDFFTDDVNKQGQLYQIAVQKIDTAAQQSSLLDFAKERAKVNVEGLLRQLGFERVDIEFKTSPK
jgi:hypothetical protein